VKKKPRIALSIKYIFKDIPPKTIQFLFSLFLISIIVVIFTLFIFLFSSSFWILLILIFYTLFIYAYCGGRYSNSIVFNLKGLSVLINENHRAINLNLPHDAIIVTHYKFSIKLLSYELGIHELVNYFQQNNRTYIVYNCYEPEDFKKVVYNPYANNLWIFGHGTRSSLTFGPGIEQKYAELSNAPKNLFVGQFHYNGFSDVDEESLADLIAYYGYVTKGDTTDTAIRQAIDVFIDIKINKNNKPPGDITDIFPPIIIN
jgi:hypothetical protein